MAERSRFKVLELKSLALRLRKKLGVRSKRPITAIELDDQVLRVVQSSLRGTRAVISRIAVESLDLTAEADRSDPQVVGKAVAKALERMRIKPGLVVMGVPRTVVVVRTLTLPVLEDPGELASMVYFQVAKDLPFRMEDAVIDFKVYRQVQPSPRDSAPKPPELHAEATPEPVAVPPPKVEVMAAAVKSHVVEFYRETAAAAGLKLVALGWMSDGNARTLEACGISEVREGLALVLLRPEEVSIDVILDQCLLFSRGAIIKPASEPIRPPGSPPEIPAAEKSPEPTTSEPSAPAAPLTYVEAASIEVVRSLHSYGGMEPHAPVARLVLAGTSGQEQAVLESLATRLNTPCTLLDPAVALDLPKAARAHAAGAISALGLVFAANDPDGLPFDFLNPKKPPVRRNLRRIRTIGGIAAGLAAMLLVGSAYSHLKTKRLLVKEQLQRQVLADSKKRPIYRQMRIQAGSVQAWSKDQQNWLEHYSYLSAILPASEEVYITSLSVGGKGTIRLGVQARSGEILAKLDKQLRAAGYEVKPLAITPGTDRHGYNFRSNVELTVPSKMKIDLTGARPPARPVDDVSLDPPTKASRRGGAQ